MSNEITVLAITAATLGFFHTLFGPDHYLPFIVMARARNWSLLKTTLITVLCGFGHVISSVLLGTVGVALGITLSKLEMVETYRGSIAGWLFIAFGFIYFVWGINKAIKNRPHRHWHDHDKSDIHVHGHAHEQNNKHVHVHAENNAENITPWILFVIFVLGPCEPLIPILMYPAAESNIFGLILVTGVFGAVTIITMLSVVLLLSLGLTNLHLGHIERYTHAIAGAIICLSGIAIQFLGL
jgi:nickel/cobalt transporter (NicO) family protein